MDDYRVGTVTLFIHLLVGTILSILRRHHPPRERINEYPWESRDVPKVRIRILLFAAKIGWVCVGHGRELWLRN